MYFKTKNRRSKMYVLTTKNSVSTESTNNAASTESSKSAVSTESTQSAVSTDSTKRAVSTESNKIDPDLILRDTINQETLIKIDLLKKASTVIKTVIQIKKVYMLQKKTSLNSKHQQLIKIVLIIVSNFKCAEKIERCFCCQLIIKKM